MEYADIDALGTLIINDNRFKITMKNEALETHCVNNIELLAYPIEAGQRVYQSNNDEFFLCENVIIASKAIGEEGDILSLINTNDRVEWFSLADENNLSSKETIYLEYDNVGDVDNLGLIINFRQTLMTTYFIYSAMGYMGKQVGDVFAKIENDKQLNQDIINGIPKELGDIDIWQSLKT